MPDMHEGYGFPVGGVAAIAPPDGVVSPGGVGYDINCGVRLLALPLQRGRARRVQAQRSCTSSRARSRRAPARRARSRSPRSELDAVLERRAASALLDRGIGSEDDLEHTESEGRLDGADPAAVSERAQQRGHDQLGTMGAGNHFVEVQRVDRVFDPATAARLRAARGTARRS